MSTKADKNQEDAKTVKIVVTSRFRDRNDHVTWYEVGTEVEFETERANNVVERGLAKEVITEG